jgi:hypothetical protein
VRASGQISSKARGHYTARCHPGSTTCSSPCHPSTTPCYNFSYSSHCYTINTADSRCTSASASTATCRTRANGSHATADTIAATTDGCDSGTLQGCCSCNGPPSPARRPQIAHGGGGVRSGNHHQDYQLVRPQLAPRMHQRVAAAPFLPEYDKYDSEGYCTKRVTTASHNTFKHLQVINRARPKLGDVHIVLFKLDCELD